jgi:hypothetical protein
MQSSPRHPGRAFAFAQSQRALNSRLPTALDGKIYAQIENNYFAAF